MPLTEIVVWISVALLLLAVGIVGGLSYLAGKMPSHDEDLDQLLAEMARPAPEKAKPPGRWS
jgi:hypothetical protein